MEIKGSALANFITEVTYSNIAEVIGTTDNAEAAKVARVRGRDDYVLIEGDTKQWTYM